MDKRSTPSKSSKPIAGNSTKSKKFSKPNTKARPKNVLIPKPKTPSVSPHSIMMGDMSVRNPESAASKLLSSSGESTNTREIVMEAICFFDISLESGEVAQTVLFSLEQGLFGVGAEPVSRPTSCEVFVLPKAVNAANSESTFVASTFLQGISDDSDATTKTLAPSINVQMTTVAPDFNIKWRRVGYFNYDKIFDNSNLRPWVHAPTGSDPVKTYQQLFCISCFDSDTGDNVLSGIQVKYKVKYRQVLPVKPSLTIATARITTFDHIPTEMTTVGIKQFAQISIKGISNVT